MISKKRESLLLLQMNYVVYGHIEFTLNIDSGHNIINKKGKVKGISIYNCMGFDFHWFWEIFIQEDKHIIGLSFVYLSSCNKYFHKINTYNYIYVYTSLPLSC